MVDRRWYSVVARVVLVLMEVLLRALGCTRESDAIRDGVTEEQSSDFEENASGVESKINKYFFDD